MRRTHRRELFRSDRGLQARMVLAAVGTPLIVLAALVAVVAIAPTKLLIGVALASVVGVGAVVRDRAAASAHAHVLAPGEEPELHTLVERLCVLADLPKPQIVVEPEAQPNSWIVGVARNRSRLHLTRGLLATLDRSELEAVIAHELAHVAHRDAAVMTAVGGPGAVLQGGGARLVRGGFGLLILGGAMAAAIGWVAGLGTRALSRYREFAADAGSAALTGRPAALASALMKVSEGMAALPREDLRAAAARDTFHLLPADRERGGNPLAPLTATHPGLRARIARLERLERALQTARPTARLPD